MIILDQRAQILGIAFGILLQFGAGVALLIEYSFSGYAQPASHSVFIGALMVAVAGLFSSYYLFQKYRESKTKPWE